MYWFKMRTSWKQPFRKLTHEEAGILINAIFDYMETGEEPELEGGADLVMSTFLPVLEDDRKQQEKAMAGKAARIMQARKAAEARWHGQCSQDAAAVPEQNGKIPEMKEHADASAGMVEHRSACPNKNIETNINTETKIQNKEKKKGRTSEAKRDHNTSSLCTESSSDASEIPVAEIILNDGSLFPVYRKEAEEYARLYPAVDIPQTLRNMVGWCQANPQRRKTRQGVRKFINAWLRKEQDRIGIWPMAKPNPYLAEARGENPYGSGMIGGIGG